MAENVKVSKLDRIRKGLVRFFREIKSELKKVVWLTRKQLVNNTVTVLAACLFIGGLIWIVDAALLKLSEVVFTR